VKLIRGLPRLALLSLAAAACAGLTGTCGSLVRTPLPNPRYRAKHRHLRSAPQVSHFLEFVGAGMRFAVFAVGGRVALRLGLSPAARSEGRPILLCFSRGRQDCQSITDPEVGGL
jgi:hypothetical protein